VKSLIAITVGLLLSVVALPIIVFAAVVGAPTGILSAAGLGAAGADGAAGVDGATGIPPEALAAYIGAAPYCPGLSWTVLAGIGEVESDHGRSPLPGVGSGANAFGAEGPMQFLPATFAAYALPHDGNPPSPYDLADAAVAAARMLCADGGADPAALGTALWAYNHSVAYVEAVLAWAARYAQSAAGGSADAGSTAAAWALAQVGKPYRWGDAGPGAFDCSGLVLRAWEAAGIELPRVAATQYGAGAHVRLADARVGDLVFFGPDPTNPSTIDHVGIYVGLGMMVDAPHTGAAVRVESLYPTGLIPFATRPSG
jgi:cell wall-associated NlpC family hydrolase